MGKAKRQDTTPESTLKDTVQKLKAICREQKKELARMHKELERREDVSDAYQEELVTAEDRECWVSDKICPDCGGQISKTTLGKYLLSRCTKCDWRERKEA